MNIRKSENRDRFFRSNSRSRSRSTRRMGNGHSSRRDERLIRLLNILNENFFSFIEVILEVVDHRMIEDVHTVVHVLVQFDPKTDDLDKFNCICVD